MCVAMNRSIWNVVFGSYASLGSAEAAIDGVHKACSHLHPPLSVLFPFIRHIEWPSCSKAMCTFAERR